MNKYLKKKTTYCAGGMVVSDLRLIGHGFESCLGTIAPYSWPRSLSWLRAIEMEISAALWAHVDREKLYS